MFRKVVASIVLFSFCFVSTAVGQEGYGSRLQGNQFNSYQPQGGGSFRDTNKGGMGTGMGQSLEGASGIASPYASQGLISATYQVHVLGQVELPGDHKVIASDRLIQAIFLAGKVLEQGSERRIELRRAGQPTRTYDLLEFKLFGKLEENPYLMDNDVIYVPFKKETVRIVGAVRRPETYELKHEKTVKDLIALAGGVTVGVSTKDSIKVVRFDSGKKEIVNIGPSGDQEEFLLHNGDVVVIPHMFIEKNKFDYNVEKLPGDNIFYPSYEERVFVLGGVNSPGPYDFSPYYSVRHYLTFARGTTKMAKKRIDVIRADGHIERAKPNMVINPGDSIVVAEKRIPPEGWISIFLGTASTVLGLTTTVLALTK
ncbi:MAG: SLBB domain-containing protein [Deltaproteobacteria bacterium]|nr:SLBB domain-containing protein [Deltaproteobacteria bacterium]